MIVNVLIPLGFNELFSYKSDFNVDIGDLVVVNFGNKNFVGMVCELNISIKDGLKLKSIEKKIDIKLKRELIEFIKWSSNWTLIPLGNLLRMVISPISFLRNRVEKKYSLNTTLNEFKFTSKQKLLIDFLKDKHFLTKNDILKNCNISSAVLNKLIINNVIVENIEKKEIIQKINNFNLNTLNQEQENALQNISNIQNYSVTLLEGITGSGKTEVYFHLIAKILKETDKQILILLPEIALTTQLIKKFINQFNFEPAIWHSEVNESKKSDIFKSVLNNNIRVVIGTRSSLFLPFKNIGLIIVDEEHDQSYRQLENGCYNARNLAIVRAKINNIPIILVSATPSLETLINVERGMYKRVYLSNRYGEASLPKIELINLKNDKVKKNKYISETLKKELEINLIKKKQSMIFMNRRGYAPIVLCTDCGERIQCKNCSANLTYHKTKKKLICHYCGYSIDKPEVCPNCLSKNLINFGPAVEKIEEEIKEYFPNAKTIIMSSDTTSTVNKLNEIVDSILNNQVDIIIGTQLIAKGHHFPNLTLVGIIDSDASLFSGDMRAVERTYQLLTQVAGRAGREKNKGIVYFQTYTPNNIILQSILNGDKELLLKYEKESRKLGNFPPYGRMAIITLSSIKEKFAYDLSKKIVSKIASISSNSDKIEVIGPSPAPIVKIQKVFSYIVIVKTDKKVNIQKLLSKMVLTEKSNYNVKIKIEIE